MIITAIMPRFLSVLVVKIPVKNKKYYGLMKVPHLLKGKVRDDTWELDSNIFF